MRITINLIPKEKKEELEFRRSGRVILKTGVMASFALVVFAVFIYFCMQVVGIYESAFDKEIEKAKKNPAYNKILETQSLIEDYYLKSAIIKKQFKGQEQYWKVYQEINTLTPEGVYFKEVIFDGASVTLKGIGKRREDIIALKEGLEREEKFEKIESPISNYIQDSNAEFELKFSVKTVGE